MRLTLPSGTLAELVRPVGSSIGPPPLGLVVIPDMMGLRPLFDDHVARLADETGWPVCAFEPWPGAEDRPVEWRIARMAERDDARTLGDAAAAADATGAMGVGIIGFCMGGMYTFKAAGTGRFRRAAAFYGMIRLPDDWRGPGQAEPLDALARRERCPTMAVIGTADPYTPPDDVVALEAAGVEVVRYEGAEHGFVHDPTRPAHRADDAADAWRRVLAFLAG
jgi:carboxymethylenebutenolidase